ncbi:hypothetical protein [Vibrio sp. 10N.222.49.B4]|uniref:hypothetical protein n=1 Tax=Vibrio sp. 10N.222.49.B4 TaxID=3229613 RepID=UPI003552342E
MMNRAIVKQGLVIGRTDLDTYHLIDEPLLNLPNSQLRLVGDKIVSAETFTCFYVDSDGTKHVANHDESWQRIDCKFDDESWQRIDCKFDDVLVYDLGVWRIQTSNDLYQQAFNEVDETRRRLYSEISDPLYMESFRKESKGLVDEAAAFRQQADAAVELIQAEHPWPTPPEV